MRCSSASLQQAHAVCPLLGPDDGTGAVILEHDPELLLGMARARAWA